MYGLICILSLVTETNKIIYCKDVFSKSFLFNLTLSLFFKFGTNYNWPLGGAATHKSWAETPKLRI